MNKRTELHWRVKEGNELGTISMPQAMCANMGVEITGIVCTDIRSFADYDKMRILISACERIGVMGIEVFYNPKTNLLIEYDGVIRGRGDYYRTTYYVRNEMEYTTISKAYSAGALWDYDGDPLRKKVENSVVHSIDKDLLKSMCKSTGLPGSELFKMAADMATPEAMAGMLKERKCCIVELCPPSMIAYEIIEDDNFFPHVNSERDLQNAYKNMIAAAELCENCIVVTTSLPYYLSDSQKRAYEHLAGEREDVDKWWINEECDFDIPEGTGLMSDEEMKLEFAFLGEDIAGKIIYPNVESLSGILGIYNQFSNFLTKKMCNRRYHDEEKIAKRELHKICMNRLSEVYEDKMRTVLAERIEKEIEFISDEGFILNYYYTSRVLEEIGLKPGDVITFGSGTNFLVAYLLGFTGFDPVKFWLPPFLVRSNYEFYIEFLEESLLPHIIRLVGCELCVVIPDSKKKMADEALCEITGQGYPVYANDIEKSDEKMARISLLPESKCLGENYMIVAHNLEGKYQGRGGVDRDSVIVPPACEEVYEYTPIEWDNRRKNVVSVYGTEDLLQMGATSVIHISGSGMLDELKKLEDITGEKAPDNIMEDDVVYAIFTKKMRERERALILRDIEGFESDRFQSIVNEWNMCDFLDVVRAYGASLGKGSYYDNVTVDSIIFMEDLYYRLRMSGAPDRVARKYTDIVADGKLYDNMRVFQDDFAPELLKYISLSDIHKFRDIVRMPAKGECLNMTMVNLRRMWYRIHYGREYLSVVRCFWVDGPFK